MSLDNINDPEGVKALLDTLRNSQAWAKAVEVARPSTLPPQGVQPFDSLRVSAPDPGDAGAPSITPSPPNLSHGTPSVADLLSQLQATQIPKSGSNTAQCSRTLDPPPAPRDHSNTLSTSNTSSDHTPPPQLDVRTLSFQQSLAHISRLGEDPNVVADLVKMKQEQDKLEKQLWDERVGIQKRHEKKVQVETTKAKLIGVDLSERERKSMSDAFQKELRKFDAERVLPAWDGLVRGQQARLEALKVPTMFVTNDPSDIEKQRLVVNVLEGILA
ncbi:hypothetical protein EDB86DRAFT_3089199 [Lactarius hatsudake]|nr:hypothetical protein EDB86DRAFT_3089199 [Lactarius hatsudake]